MSYDFAFQTVLFLSVGGALISSWTFALTLFVWWDARTEEGKEIYRTPPKIHWPSLFLSACLVILAYCLMEAL